MSFDTRVFIVSNIKLSINASHQEAFLIAKNRLKRFGLNVNNAQFSVYKKSVDARKKQNVHFVYSIAAVNVFGKADDQAIFRDGISMMSEVALPNTPSGTEASLAPPLIVGAGPCGLFAALILAERGYNPTIIERGGSIEDRKNAVKLFYKNKVLNTETNIQFGAGGAGTFSDGKLVTRVNDPFTSYVLAKLIENGAPREILYLSRPHIGTDVLSVVVENILKKIESLGGQIFYNTKYISSYNTNGIDVARTDKMDIPYSSLILAIGHSARDTYQNLLNRYFDIEPKPFSVGMRIEHLTSDIDRALYGDFAGHEALGHAEYNLSYNTKARGVYTFCMCPGGEVVAAASEYGGVVVNGMSYNARNGVNSNSAVVCTVFKEDYGATPQKAIDFQRAIEQKAYVSTGGDYTAPIITVGDFISDKLTSEPSRVLPTYMNGRNVRLTNPNEYLPKFITDNIKNALCDFDNKIHGFAARDAVLTGAETRTSAPVRILRDAQTRLAIGKQNIYPAGEGAGYAGGIISAAIDGIRTALKIIERFSQKK